LINEGIVAKFGKIKAIIVNTNLTIAPKAIYIFVAVY
jgi:hypothetical protein